MQYNHAASFVCCFLLSLGIFGCGSNNVETSATVPITEEALEEENETEKEITEETINNPEVQIKKRTQHTDDESIEKIVLKMANGDIVTTWFDPDGGILAKKVDLPRIGEEVSRFYCVDGMELYMGKWVCMKSDFETDQSPLAVSLAFSTPEDSFETDYSFVEAEYQEDPERPTIIPELGDSGDSMLENLLPEQVTFYDEWYHPVFQIKYDEYGGPAAFSYGDNLNSIILPQEENKELEDGKKIEKRIFDVGVGSKSGGWTRFSTERLYDNDGNMVCYTAHVGFKLDILHCPSNITRKYEYKDDGTIKSLKREYDNVSQTISYDSAGHMENVSYEGKPERNMLLKYGTEGALSEAYFGDFGIYSGLGTEQLYAQLKANPELYRSSVKCNPDNSVDVITNKGRVWSHAILDSFAVIIPNPQTKNTYKSTEADNSKTYHIISYTFDDFHMPVEVRSGFSTYDKEGHLVDEVWNHQEPYYVVNEIDDYKREYHNQSNSVFIAERSVVPFSELKADMEGSLLQLNRRSRLHHGGQTP